MNMADDASHEDEDDAEEEAAPFDLRKDIPSDVKTEETSAKPPPKDGSQKPWTLLQFLKDTKELITLILFFVGGIVWLYAAFATKHYVASVKCLLGATIERIDNDSQSKQYQVEIVELNVRLQQVQNSGRPVLDIINEVETLKQKVEDFKGKKQLADESAKKASQKAANGECGE